MKVFLITDYYEENVDSVWRDRQDAEARCWVLSQEKKRHMLVKALKVDANEPSCELVYEAWYG